MTHAFTDIKKRTLVHQSCDCIMSLLQVNLIRVLRFRRRVGSCGLWYRGSRKEEFAGDPEPVALGPNWFTDVCVWGME